MKKYMLRLFDDVLEKIKIQGAVLTIGPKWYGKSTIAKQCAKSVLEFQNPRTRENNLEIENTRPVFFCQRVKPKTYR